MLATPIAKLNSSCPLKNSSRLLIVALMVILEASMGHLISVEVAWLPAIQSLSLVRASMA